MELEILPNQVNLGIIWSKLPFYVFIYHLIMALR